MIINTYPINPLYAPYNNHYLNRLKQTLDFALTIHPRTLAVILILRYPDYLDNGDSIQHSPNMGQGVFSRFIESLNAKMLAYQRRKKLAGKRVYHCKVNYSWVKEWTTEGKPHYHAVLYFNHDTFFNLGNLRRSNNLGSFIQEAWCSALSINSGQEYSTLVHFPENSLYILNINYPYFDQTYQDLLLRLSYFAKERSKIYNKQERTFGSSRIRNHF